MTITPPSQATARGTLDGAPLAQLFAYLLDKKLSGTLELDGPDGALGTIVFRDGSPIKARTPEPHYLGMVLHTLGLVDSGQLNASLARLASERRLHGQILREMDALTEEGLQRGLRSQLAEKLEPLFGLPKATQYRFYDAFDALTGWGGPETVAVDPLPILWSALERWPPAPHVEKALGRVPADARMRVVPRFDLTRFRFAKRTHDLLELMRQKPLTLSEMTREVDASQARLVVYCLLMTKQVVFAIGDPATTAPPRPPLQSFSPTSPSFQPPPPSHAPVAPISSQAPSKLRPSAPPPGVDLTPELVARRRQIIERAAVIAEEDFFSVLGTSRSAPPEAAQQSYLALAKAWHPDRLAPQLFDVRDLAAKVFARMSEARATLTDANKRAEYALSLRQAPRGAPSAAPGVNAPLEYQKAEVLLKKKSYVEAVDHCRRAHEADPSNADYLALLTWIRIEKDGASNEHAARYMEALDRAVRLNERCERAYFYRAMLFKRLGKPDKAYVDFKEAAELNPNNIDAAREVLLYKKRAT